MMSFAHCFRLGVERSAMRNVGWIPRPFGTNGWAGSLVMGPGVPATAVNAPPLPVCQAVWPEEKSGGEADCAAAPAATAAPTAKTAETRMPTLARSICLEVNVIIGFSPRWLKNPAWLLAAL